MELGWNGVPFSLGGIKLPQRTISQIFDKKVQRVNVVQIKHSLYQ